MQLGLVVLGRLGARLLLPGELVLDGLVDLELLEVGDLEQRDGLLGDVSDGELRVGVGDRDGESLDYLVLLLVQRKDVGGVGLLHELAHLGVLRLEIGELEEGVHEGRFLIQIKEQLLLLAPILDLVVEEPEVLVDRFVDQLDLAIRTNS